VTSGIVSALARTRVGVTDYQFFIQTNAAINPGNSGGALVDMKGRLLGINTAIFSRTGGSLGIGFAIPANMVRLVVESALQGGRAVRRPWLGAQLQPVTAEIAEALGLEKRAGAVVSAITPGGPADVAGLRLGDVIVSVEGREVADPNAFNYRFTTRGLSGTVAIGVLRNGRALTFSVALMPAPETVPRDERDLSGAHPLSGARVANLSPALAEELAIAETSGVVILETDAYSAARRVGVRPGDIIAEVNGRPVTSTESLQQMVVRGARVWRLTIRRGGRELQTVIAG
jgi:S1-C subfamily serine protease